MTFNRRVTWQATSNAENSWPRFSVALPRGRLRRAQQAAMPVIGFLRSTSLADVTHLVTAFRHGLRETGYVEGQNVAIEYRSAEDNLDRLPALVADLIRRPVAV